MRTLNTTRKRITTTKNKKTYRGQVWSKNCRGWIYYDCCFDIEQLRKRFNLHDFIKYHFNDDGKSELG